MNCQPLAHHLSCGAFIWKHYSTAPSLRCATNTSYWHVSTYFVSKLMENRASAPLNSRTVTPSQILLEGFGSISRVLVLEGQGGVWRGVAGSDLSIPDITLESRPVASTSVYDDFSHIRESADFADKENRTEARTMQGCVLQPTRRAGRSSHLFSTLYATRTLSQN